MRLIDLDSRRDYMLDGKYAVLGANAEPPHISLRDRIKIENDFYAWARKRRKNADPQNVIMYMLNKGWIDEVMLASDIKGK